MQLNYMHFFRALAVTFIVTGHTIDAFVWTNEELVKILRIVISNGSVLFVFIAGYLFQHLSKKFDAKKFYRSKLTNVVTPYLIVSIPAIYLSISFFEQDTVYAGFYDQTTTMQVLGFLLTGAHLAPLWFIPMMCILFAVAPFLLRLEKLKGFYYLLPLALLISCLYGRGLPLQNVFHFFSAYMFGMFCSRYKDVVNEVIRQKIFISCALAVVGVFTAIEFYLVAEETTYVNYLQKMFMSVLFLGVFVRYDAVLTSPFVKKVADYSFGIFFIHAYVLTAGKMLYANQAGTLATGDITSFVLTAVLVILVCSSSVGAAKRVLGSRSRLLLGS